jgi:prostaglandin reductase 1
MSQKAKVYLYANKYVGEPKLSDFELTEEILDPLKEGEFLAEALYFPINAGLRAYVDLYPIGSIIVGGQVARYNLIFYSFFLNQIFYLYLF